jgi:hypothetical protein
MFIPILRNDITKYRTERVVKSEPEDKTKQNPGLLCWGDTGTLPTPKAVTTGFEVVDPDEEHVEMSRETEDVNIYDKNNPDNYVTAARTKQMLFNVTDKTSSTSGNNNTSTGGEDFGGFAPSDIELTDFSPLGSSSKKKKLRVKFSNNDGTI